jgi:predicted RNA-binding Zn-ribbon protein involved in translation (DUF1610 family)
MFILTYIYKTMDGHEEAVMKRETLKELFLAWGLEFITCDYKPEFLSLKYETEPIPGIVWTEDLDPTPDEVGEVDFMPTVNGKPFECEECGVRIFRKLVKDTKVYACNGCGTRYRGE